MPHATFLGGGAGHIEDCQKALFNARASVEPYQGRSRSGETRWGATNAYIEGANYL